jgi:hypothetical protein
VQHHGCGTIFAYLPNSSLVLHRLFSAFSTGSSLSSPDLSSATEGAKDAADSAADDIKGAASDLKAKAKGALSGLSALPNNTATIADLNADVRYEASDYRDPAIATPQDKVQDKLAGEHCCCKWAGTVGSSRHTCCWQHRTGYVCVCWGLMMLVETSV